MQRDMDSDYSLSQFSIDFQDCSIFPLDHEALCSCTRFEVYGKGNLIGSIQSSLDCGDAACPHFHSKYGSKQLQKYVDCSRLFWLTLVRGLSV